MKVPFHCVFIGWWQVDVLEHNFVSTTRLQIQLPDAVQELQ